MSKRSICFIFIVCIAWNKSNCQQIADSTHILREVNVSSKRLTSPDSTATLFIPDTSYIGLITAPSISELLNGEAPVFVKSYGEGSSTTISLRGTSAQQTAVLWNGMNICSPMHGQSDLSLIPSFLIDETSIQFGGPGSLLGSGNIGGVVHLDSRQDLQKGFGMKALLGIGSFGFSQKGIGLNFSNGHADTKTKLYTQGADNNFPYTDPYNNPAKQVNAGVYQTGISQDFNYFRRNNSISLHGWYLKSDRQIPPGMLSASSDEEQSDESIKLSGEWNSQMKKLLLNLRAGWSKDKLNYSNPKAYIDDKSTAQSIQSEAGITYPVSDKFKFALQLAAITTSASADGYDSKEEKDEISAAFQIKYSSRLFAAQASLRQSMYNGDAVPLIPSAGFLWKVYKGFSLKVNATAAYRVPTLNDLYWKPGGNQDLVPENGHSESMSILWEKKNSSFEFETEAGIFNIRMNESLVWIPGSNGIYYAANINQTNSSGVDGTLKMIYFSRTLRYKLQFSPQYNISTILKTIPQYAEAEGKQMIYSPKILFKAMAELKLSAFSLRYYHEYTGTRYVTLDNSQELEPYSIGSLVVGWEKNFGEFNITFTATCKNIFDTSYQVIAYRAMPGRSYQTGIFLSFSGKQ